MRSATCCRTRSNFDLGKGDRGRISTTRSQHVEPKHAHREDLQRVSALREAEFRPGSSNQIYFS